jgi:transmembrane sensor
MPDRDEADADFARTLAAMRWDGDAVPDALAARLATIADEPALGALRAQALDRAGRGAAAPAESAILLPFLRRVRPIHWAAGLAACLTLAVGVDLTRTSNAPTSLASAPAQVLANGIARPRDVRLADGSTVTLDASSRVDLPPWTTRRDLDLMQGRAFFKVAHDKARPFTVRALGYAVVATGTAFTVERSPGGVRVMLVEGHVRVTGDGGGGAITLNPGDELILNQGAPRLTHVDAARASDWRTGLLRFDDRPAAVIVAELNRYLDRPVRLRDPALGATRLSGTFRAGDAATLRATLDALGIVTR